MLTKNDVISILVRLGDTGLSVTDQLKKAAYSSTIPQEVLKFIAKNNGIEILKFYDHIRKNYNQKKSFLYINIIDQTRLNTNQDVLTTLSSLLNQILLYGKKLESSFAQVKFYEEARAKEITKVLNQYFETQSIENCTKLLALIKSDLVVLEYLIDRRDLITEN